MKNKRIVNKFSLEGKLLTIKSHIIICLTTKNPAHAGSDIDNGINIYN